MMNKTRTNNNRLSELYLGTYLVKNKISPLTGHPMTSEMNPPENNNKNIYNIQSNDKNRMVLASYHRQTINT